MTDVIKYERTEQGVRLVPVYRDETKDYFVDAEKVQPWAVELEGQHLLTGALKIGTLFDLIGISQTEDLLQTGVQDLTDALDPNIALESIFVEAKYPDGSSKVQRYEFGRANEQQVGAQFTFSAQHRRQIEVNYHTNTLHSPSANSAMDLHVAGLINLELGHCELVASGVTTATEPNVEHEVIGYTLKAFRVNHNRQPREAAVAPAGEAPLSLKDEVNHGLPESPMVTYQGVPFNPFDWVGLVGQGLQDDYRAFLETTEQAIDVWLSAAPIQGGASPSAIEYCRAQLLAHYAVKWMSQVGIPVVIFNGTVVMGDALNAESEQDPGDVLEKDPTLRLGDPISVFSGAEYDPSRYAVDTVITDHIVPGQATDLQLKVGDAVGPGNANHRYDITGFNTSTNPSEYDGSMQLMLSLIFQNGTIPEKGHNGITLEVMYAAVAHRLEGFQSGPFATADNEEALYHTRKALEALQRRTRSRIARQVEGTHQV
jgi:hypothetical protein